MKVLTLTADTTLTKAEVESYDSIKPMGFRLTILANEGPVFIKRLDLSDPISQAQAAAIVKHRRAMGLGENDGLCNCSECRASLVRST
jgi:hypothetical protein